ncbi:MULTISPECIES: carbonic anhydrase family protein [Croceitalea]|uniref:Carbonic anhydrase family protein n=1 Tax=Croceitalea vernalis TaxID=3075599 RepID=A0ABU3BCX0_9FLAO|nr:MULTISPECIES: carbonic anhydrase family protein [unclassified Croceitalea]MDT0538540.1 carbonic anhydrase family protein [Croceitalea sp. P059]MDT0620320.1 carbonic anhydrase family protein [Croceitalea sp. P007]
MITQTQETQAVMTPDAAITLLKEGNARFVEKKMTSRDLITQVKQTTSGQYPFATVLSCIDSRVSAELVFDQGVGDIFSARVAGNIVNEDILGSMEFACKLAGTKLIVVLGHTSCGAVKGACDDAKMGNLTTLLHKIKPAVRAVNEPSDDTQRNSKNLDFVNAVANKNIHLTIEDIRSLSPVLKDMEDNGEISIVGAMYDIADGRVHFL